MASTPAKPKQTLNRQAKKKQGNCDGLGQEAPTMDIDLTHRSQEGEHWHQGQRELSRPDDPIFGKEKTKLSDHRPSLHISTTIAQSFDNFNAQLKHLFIWILLLQ